LGKTNVSCLSITDRHAGIRRVKALTAPMAAPSVSVGRMIEQIGSDANDAADLFISFKATRAQC
jgi:hypothetical protein